MSFSLAVLSAIMMSVAFFIVMLCHYAECHYAECPYAEFPYAECPYAECHYAECRGALNLPRKGRKERSQSHKEIEHLEEIKTFIEI